MPQATVHPKIIDLIPHRGRMLLIDEIEGLSLETAVSSAIVKDSWPLMTEDGVSSLILIELAAQTSGLCNGLSRNQEQGEDSDKSGFLVGIKQVVLHVDSLPLGTKVHTFARNQFKFESFREIEGVCKVGPDVVCEVTLQVMRVEG